ncbi:hypothetical protein DFH07DRAFT_453899 [Mycena maculata]|uniref:Uncharacterized protein n=1 Tax=Mycena maculata TaxID=230809 RepID=A0AAD7J8T6_9AGAR|nr:hypothetical protein DFH07DRAFT_453899 [Mycena maculata]
MAALRNLLLEPPRDDNGCSIKQVSDGSIPSLSGLTRPIPSRLCLKKGVETKRGTVMKMTLIGGAEAHLLAPGIAAAGVGVILSPPSPFPYNWEHRRMHLTRTVVWQILCLIARCLASITQHHGWIRCPQVLAYHTQVRREIIQRPLPGSKFPEIVSPTFILSIYASH